ncbi:hypothetical protein LTR05_005648 [Lithohypha guttulata]|uniref:Endonuclease/exonuclease/phosphatase domain-containing protein n=1 Tax=Lithohypha guttulata TaxID=1690604 RepID=A0AAN7YFP4_9EURO|nr:hypothetical protein LTR05_005648 [Lithohypha guttulata]
MSPSAVKRKLSSSARSVSPPPLRRRTDAVQAQRAAQTESTNHSHKLNFYSWNVNGIGPLLQKQISFTPDATYPLRNFLKAHEWPHFLCLQEVKINRADTATQRRVELAANAGAQSDEPTYSTHFSLPRDKYNATGFSGKVHGTATLTRDDTLETAASVPDFDLEGRVLIHEFATIPLVVINGYWVNGTSNPYRNPDTGETQGTRHDHKLRFHKHMLDLCKSIEERRKSVLLLGDMNVAPTRIDGHPNLRTSPIQHVINRADFNLKFLDKDSETGLKGIDVFRHLHGEKKKYTYHGRGRPWGESCDRVDLIVASRKLVDDEAVVMDTDICDNPHDRGHSDHVPLWVSLDASTWLNQSESKVD